MMTLIERNIRPRDICTRQAFENAARIVAATGGSTNGALHLPAMANEAGIDFDLFDVAEIFKTTPYIADLKPGGKYVAKDMYDAGGVYMLMKTLFEAGFLHGDCMTVTGKTLAENIDRNHLEPRPEGDLSGVDPAVADRRRRRPEGLAGARWCHRQGGRHGETAVQRTGASL